MKAFGQEARERVSRLPGVLSVSWASNMPLWAASVSGLQVEAHQSRSQADKISAIVDTVGPNFLRPPAWLSKADESSRTPTRRPLCRWQLSMRRWQTIIGRA
jgi:hypothetical protein